ncbi:MAG: alanine--glyoxylate aminotransferase family protein, partial [Thermoanaerobaculia bacterium]
MLERHPLLMIPGPVEISPAVRQAAAIPPQGHTTPRVLEAFGTCMERMRQVWRADAASQPFILAGSGTLAMEMAAANLLEPGERALVVNSGYFSGRMAEILRRYGVEVLEVGAPVGEAPPPEAVRETLEKGGPAKALFVTHVDTSTGVRVDPEPLCRLA